LVHLYQTSSLLPSPPCPSHTPSLPHSPSFQAEPFF
jgi:hypothetical protein